MRLAALGSGNINIDFLPLGSGSVRILTGNLAFGSTTPTARLHLPAGATGTNTAPLKFTSGSLNTTPEAGTIEYNGTTFTMTAADLSRQQPVTFGHGTV